MKPTAFDIRLTAIDSSEYVFHHQAGICSFRLLATERTRVTAVRILVKCYTGEVNPWTGTGISCAEMQRVLSSCLPQFHKQHQLDERQ
jgi:hypothetical protein